MASRPSTACSWRLHFQKQTNKGKTMSYLPWSWGTWTTSPELLKVEARILTVRKVNSFQTQRCGSEFYKLSNFINCLWCWRVENMAVIQPQDPEELGTRHQRKPTNLPPAQTSSGYCCFLPIRPCGQAPLPHPRVFPVLAVLHPGRSHCAKVECCTRADSVCVL